jgi:leucyl aminopeptidase
MTILESYRALLASDFHPIRPVEFHWYSAEVSHINVWCLLSLMLGFQEGGLLGSQAVAQHYEAQGLNVYAMSQVGAMQYVVSHNLTRIVRHDSMGKERYARGSWCDR